MKNVFVGCFSSSYIFYSLHVEEKQESHGDDSNAFRSQKLKFDYALKFSQDVHFQIRIFFSLVIRICKKTFASLQLWREPKIS